MTSYTPAHRVRSALAAASSVDVVWDEGAQTVHRAPCVTDAGDLLLRGTAGTPLEERLARAGREGADVRLCLTLTDLVPLAVRDRVRGRAALAGWAGLVEGAAGRDPVAGEADGPAVRVRPEEVRWQAGARPGRRPRPATVVPVQDYRGAAPDPLAADEADLLLAVAAAPGLVASLAAHLPACVVVDPRRAPVPVRVDREGIVLRVDGAERTVDARLAFRHDAATPALAWAALEELLERV